MSKMQDLSELDSIVNKRTWEMEEDKKGCIIIGYSIEEWVAAATLKFYL